MVISTFINLNYYYHFNIFYRAFTGSRRFGRNQSGKLPIRQKTNSAKVLFGKKQPPSRSHHPRFAPYNSHYGHQMVLQLQVFVASANTNSAKCNFVEYFITPPPPHHNLTSPPSLCITLRQKQIRPKDTRSCAHYKYIWRYLKL